MQATGSIATTDIAEAFVQARRDGVALPDYPGTIPTSMDEAYRVQDRALSLSDSRVGGWKVGKIDPPVEGQNRLSGPIFADGVVTDDAPAMPIFGDGFGAVEAEFLLRIGTAPNPAKTSYTMAEARALIDAVHAGIEIASSPFPGINDNGPLVTISDFGNNFGLVVGPSIDGWPEADLNAWRLTLSINDETVGDANAATMLDGPIGAARFLFEHMARRGIALSAGQWISSGAVTGVHRVHPGDAVRVTFGDTIDMRCSITAL